MTQLINSKFNKTKVKSYDVLTPDENVYTLTFTFKNLQAYSKIHKKAIRLNEHLEIIDESRKAIREGYSQTSDEFMNGKCSS